MHGVKRVEVLRDEVDDEEIKRVSSYLSLVSEFEKCRVEHASPTWILSTTAALLLVNPEYLSAWNLRKQTLLKTEVKLTEELEFSVACIKVNPKSYAAWYHRRWLMEHLVPTELDSTIAPLEVNLCNKLLDLDARNFHGWNYRTFLFNRFQLKLESELDYTGLKIYQNFSNYSAWHRRSQLIALIQDPIQKQAILENDFNLVKSAYFTEPADQSAWFYLRWLLREVPEQRERELRNVEELLQLEPEAPLALWTWCWLAKQLGLDIGDKQAILKRVDPMRTGLYT